MSESPQRLSGLTREQFIAQLGLTPEDMADPSRQKLTEPSTEETAALREAGGVPPVLLDEVFFRTAEIADPSVVRATQITAQNEYREKEITKFREYRSGGSYSENSPSRDLKSEVKPEDHEAAQGYRSNMLADFRARKQSGQAKSLPEPPQRRPPQKQSQATTSAESTSAADAPKQVSESAEEQPDALNDDHSAEA